MQYVVSNHSRPCLSQTSLSLGLSSSCLLNHRPMLVLEKRPRFPGGTSPCFPEIFVFSPTKTSHTTKGKWEFLVFLCLKIIAGINPQGTQHPPLMFLNPRTGHHSAPPTTPSQHPPLPLMFLSPWNRRLYVSGSPWLAVENIFGGTASLWNQAPGTVLRFVAGAWPEDHSVRGRDPPVVQGAARCFAAGL